MFTLSILTSPIIGHVLLQTAERSVGRWRKEGDLFPEMRKVKLEDGAHFSCDPISGIRGEQAEGRSGLSSRSASAHGSASTR
ncbi:hypothetical protein CRENBAI_001818 [Crenichthys baileyi]|uniref:Uncharacterized protein n=1 Tax=Crenichthys baileyi TaxID=28760 RepID=A0AAV9S241_9TELE